jgi:flagellar biosynthesis protein FliR
MTQELLHHVPAFVLVVFRLAGMMLLAPLFGSVRVPARVKGLLVLILALGLTPRIAPELTLPADTWSLAIGIGGEIVFGLAMGMVVSFVFIAAQWAGEMVGQQMGLSLSEVFDPQFGQQRSLIGEVYYMLTMAVFLLMDGHRALVIGIRASFESLPLLSVGMSESLLAMLVGLFDGAAALALQLAAPVLMTMLVVDLSLGFISKTMPQINVLTAGLSIRAMVGMVLLVLCVTLVSDVLRAALDEAMENMLAIWSRLAY